MQNYSNKHKIIETVKKYPGLRFHQIKKQSKLANGTVEHHLNHLSKNEVIKVRYDGKIPRYYTSDIEEKTQVILLRLRQNTTSRIIKSLLKNDCLNFSQLVKESKKSPGTVSIYKNMLLEDKIIVGNTDECSSCPMSASKISYKIVNPKLVRTLVEEYGKISLRKSADNLADIFLSIK